MSERMKEKNINKALNIFNTGDPRGNQSLILEESSMC